MCTLYWIYFKMATSEETAAHRSVIRFCVELGLTPVETQKEMFSTERHKNVSRALIYKWHRRYSDGLRRIPQLETRGRPKGKDGSVIKNVKSVINTDRRQTVRQVADTAGCGKSTVHRALSGDLSMSRVSARGTRTTHAWRKDETCRGIAWVSNAGSKRQKVPGPCYNHWWNLVTLLWTGRKTRVYRVENSWNPTS